MEGKIVASAMKKQNENLKLTLQTIQSSKTMKHALIDDFVKEIIVEKDYKVKRNLDQNGNERLTKSLSEVQQFYNGKNIFITGATGFLGKILIEKLLRSCPGIESMYLLVRQKKGKDIYTRVEEIFEDPVFDLLKDTVPKFRHKIVVISGDCDSIGLGLSLTDRQILAEKINIIFHAAATVKFDEHLRAALNTNVRAPLHLLRLARDMKGLNVLMHVSTAYSNSHLKKIEEKFYTCKVNCEQLYTLVDKLNDKEIDELLPSILGTWPNTYTFTKALAEKELKDHSKKMPIGIFRPAIVTSTAKEPLKAWIDNMYGPTGVVVGVGTVMPAPSVPNGRPDGICEAIPNEWAALLRYIGGKASKFATGVLRTLQCNKYISAEIVPVDFVVNCLICAAKHIYTDYQSSSPPEEPPIFNYVSSVENRITWHKFMEYNLKFLNIYPLSAAIWYSSLALNKSCILNTIYMIFLHLIPAAFIDGLAICLGQKPKLLKLYRKIHKFSSVLSYFTTHDIEFCNKRTRQLWDATSSDDKEIFPFSMNRLNWSKYFDHYIRGIRIYIFKENEDNLLQARTKWRRLFVLDQSVRLLFVGLVFYLIWIIFNKIFLN